jgi:hypothetical protein
VQINHTWHQSQALEAGASPVGRVDDGENLDAGGVDHRNDDVQGWRRIAVLDPLTGAWITPDGNDA